MDMKESQIVSRGKEESKLVSKSLAMRFSQTHQLLIDPTV